MTTPSATPGGPTEPAGGPDRPGGEPAAPLGAPDPSRPPPPAAGWTQQPPPYPPAPYPPPPGSYPPGAPPSGYRRLTLSQTDRKIGGVCGGIAEYFAIDPTLVRVVAIVLAFFGGAGVLAYLVSWLIIPKE
jgi:phage shock protein C